ncbi:hypothetical protein C0J45_4323 [Silurus meridionalis]|nr:hypothetical protein C0J45_4323 [Silurus meridionalis]
MAINRKSQDAFRMILRLGVRGEGAEEEKEKEKEGVLVAGVEEDEEEETSVRMKRMRKGEFVFRLWLSPTVLLHADALIKRCSDKFSK